MLGSFLTKAVVDGKLAAGGAEEDVRRVVWKDACKLVQ